jgi:hypothetical protein
MNRKSSGSPRCERNIRRNNLVQIRLVPNKEQVRVRLRGQQRRTVLRQSQRSAGQRLRQSGERGTHGRRKETTCSAIRHMCTHPLLDLAPVWTFDSAAAVILNPPLSHSCSRSSKLSRTFAHIYCTSVSLPCSLFFHRFITPRFSPFSLSVPETST